MDLSNGSPEQLELIVSRHRDAGKMKVELCLAAMAELSTRTVKRFDLKRAIDHLIEAAKAKAPTDLKSLAIAPSVFDEDEHVWATG